MSNLKTVIGGSYRKHLKELMEVKNHLLSYDIEVLSPVGSHAINPTDEFVVLDHDPIDDPQILQDSIFAKMRTSSFHVVCNTDGYIGAAALIEFGYAIALGLKILTVEPVQDPNLAPYCRLLWDVFPKKKEYLK